MKRPIYMIPRETALLRSRSVRCRSVAEVRDVVQDLTDTWPTVAAHGIAAPQIGVLKRLFIYRPYDAPEDEPPTVLINPRVIKVSGELKDFDGCLSVPTIYGQTRRAARIDILATTLDGRTARHRFEEFDARIIQHEMDHLDGVLFIDRLDALEDLYTYQEVERAEGDGEAAGDEPAVRQVPLTPAQRAFIEANRRPLPGVALRW